MRVNQFSEYVLRLLMQTNDIEKKIRNIGSGTVATDKRKLRVKVRAEIIEQQGDTHSHPAQLSCP